LADWWQGGVTALGAAHQQSRLYLATKLCQNSNDLDVHNRSKSAGGNNSQTKQQTT